MKWNSGFRKPQHCVSGWGKKDGDLIRIGGVEDFTVFDSKCQVVGHEAAHDPMILEWCFRAPVAASPQKEREEKQDEISSERGASEHTLSAFETQEEISSERGASEHVVSAFDVEYEEEAKTILVASTWAPNKEMIDNDIESITDGHEQTCCGDGSLRE